MEKICNNFLKIISKNIKANKFLKQTKKIF
jgi:hypothetical protein